MKQLITSLLLAVTMGCGTASAQPADAQDNHEGLQCLKNGHLTMAIDGAKGGKILSFKYDDQEIISQSRWPETFGSTFWTSPQKEWYWPPVPEYDKKPYEMKQDGNVLTMTSGVSEKLKYRIRKQFAIDEKEEAFVITYSIINESDEVRKVAPWEMTRVPNEDGLIFFEVCDSIWPAGLMSFKDEHGMAWYQPDEANENRKVNTDGKGWLAYCSKEKGLLLVKKFQDLDAQQPAPGEAEIQVYVNRGKTYIELESQGAYTTLKPKEELSWTVRWYLQPCKATSAEEIAKKVKEILHNN